MEDTPKVGLEIHCQLDTQHKLFCSCPTVLSQKKSSKQFLRRLRPTQSELGVVDPAALFEFQKGWITISCTFSIKRNSNNYFPKYISWL